MNNVTFVSTAQTPDGLTDVYVILYSCPIHMHSIGQTKTLTTLKTFVYMCGLGVVV